MRPDLPRRIVGGLIAAALALGALLAGGGLLGLAVAAAVYGMGREWCRLVVGRDDLATVAAVVSPAIAALALLTILDAWATPPGLLLRVTLLMLGLALASGLVMRHALDRRSLPLEASLYIGLPALCVLWLVRQPDGLEVVLWLVFVVAATDIAAYLAGSTLGGPRLAPSISPGKTWTGLFGGMLGAAAVGTAGASWAHWSPPVAGGAAIALALVAQAGDLFESRLKRRAGVKDSGSLIPGHGGLLDRLDGYLFAVPTLTVIVAALGEV